MSVKETFSAGQTREFFGGGDFFRLLETVAEITVEFFWQGREVAEAIGVQAGYAEYFRDRRFDRIRIYSATAQDIKWVTREGSDVRYDRGAASITGSVDLNAVTIAALKKPDASTGNWNSSAALALNTPQTIFAPGANLNGVTVLAAGSSIVGNAALAYGTFVAKAGAAPATPSDGEVILTPTCTAGTSNYLENSALPNEVFLPAGMGLYYICSGPVFVGPRYARWKAH